MKILIFLIDYNFVVVDRVG